MIPIDRRTDTLRRWLTELIDFVRIPSISAEPSHAGDMRRCAKWLRNHLMRIGLRAKLISRQGHHPIVYAHWRGAPGQPTLLIYGHYDVQPIDPLDEWHHPPFEPVVRDGALYGRGASDDKGPLLAHAKAIEMWLRETGRLPVNVTCLFDGEEEIGSPHLLAWMRRQKPDALKADVAVISDTRMLGADRPAITYALRGSLSVELQVHGPRGDLHPGAFGGAVHNPAQALCGILASLHDRHGRIAVPGFYDDVREVDAAERAYLRNVGPPDKQILRDAGSQMGWGEPSYTLYERTTIRPALTISGLHGGYAGAGHKSVLPATATAKLNFRLVPDQDPDRILYLLRQHLSRVTPSTVQAKLLGSDLTAKPVEVDRRHPAVRAAAAAYERSFGRKAILLRSGGTIPVVSAFQTELGIPTVLMGFALPDDGMHAPNEKFRLANFFRGVATSARFMGLLGSSRSVHQQSRPHDSR